MKKIFAIDWALLPAFVITTYSGFELHIAGHFASHEVWHNWAVLHTLASLAFIILGIWHIQTHWGWYKAFIKKGLGNKSRITLFLSVLFIIASITGVVLLGVEGASSSIGLWHYRLGIVLTILGMGHFFKRYRLLMKASRKTAINSKK